MKHNFGGVAVPRCQHVRTTGIRCGSPALSGRPHCYYHTAFRQPTRVIRDFEDAESIQLALRQVVNWIAQGMDTKRAALTLYALQIASSNLKSMSRIIHAKDVVCELPDETENETYYADPKETDASEQAPRKPSPRKSKSLKSTQATEATATLQPVAPSPSEIPDNGHLTTDDSGKKPNGHAHAPEEEKTLANQP